MNSREQDFLAGIEYLTRGNSRQQDAYRVLRKLQVMETLEAFSPVLVGTVPIDVDIPESDLDIICQVEKEQQRNLEAVVRSGFDRLEGFKFVARVVEGVPRQVARFRQDSWAVEIFGQPVPVNEQNGYRHMVVEHRILQLLGDPGKEAIRKLKRQGYKTEPAFGQLLQLEGDPYLTLLDMYHWTSTRLEAGILKRKEAE